MKLSEVLKEDWPEKYGIYSSITGGELPESNSRNIQFQYGYNTAITSCDREIDKEALARALSSIYGFKEWDGIEKSVKEFFIEDAGSVISTMPTWLKRTEK